ncbi:diguanylate cyclase [Anoxybacterium hadale]|uniref:Diguanylate cyclase n=1 Tax=Anoxybacterium hadale TaxID=3408580 RepID=A0ACD1A6E7_9FIRM|nr:diguanylate cyclase [Clostridiales bacterium]
MRKKHTAIFVLIVIIFLSLISIFISKPTDSYPPEITGGVLDLRDWSFEKDGMVTLKGEWTFYFNQFLTHSDFMSGNCPKPILVQVPSTRKSMAESKPFNENQYYGTLRLVVKLPDQWKPYGLKTNIILTSYQLYIDGRLSGEVGKVGTSRENSKPYYNILTTYFNPEQNEVELIYHTSDFWAQDSVITAPKLGLAQQISREQQIGLGRDLFLFGMLLIMGIYHVGLYFMRSKDPAPLYFAVFCLLFSLRMLLVGERFLPSRLELDFFLYGRVAYLCVFIGFTALCGFLYYTLEGLFPRWFLKAGTALGLVFGILMLWIPYYLADRMLMVYAAAGFALMGYSIIRLAVGVLRSYPFAQTVLLGFAMLGITFINDFVYQITLSNTPSLIPLGVIVFTFTQAYTLSARFSSAFTDAERLSVENQTILQELKLMNSNLESLVEERTSDLQKAFKEMEAMSKTDYLTKLPNRRFALAKIEQLKEAGKSFCIGLADIDYFKEINDRYGHMKGDEILIQIAGILQHSVGDSGFAGRWGGEEFLLLLEINELKAIQEKAESIRRSVEDYRYSDIEEHITITIGICLYAEDMSVSTMIAKADQYLYQGKAAGRNRCVIDGSVLQPAG